MMPQATFMLAPLLLLGFGPISSSLSDELKARLLKWEVVSRTLPASATRPVQAMGLVPTSVQPVLDVLVDVQSYPGLFPRVTSARRVKQDLYRLTARFPWPMGDGWVVARLHKWRERDVHVLRWKMVHGSFKRYEMTVRVEPWTPHRCLLSVRMHAVPRSAFLRVFMGWGLRRAAEQLVHAVRMKATHPRKPQTGGKRAEHGIGMRCGVQPSRCLPSTRRPSEVRRL